MVEVWNEPSPGGPYWTGTRDDYFELFRIVAARLHRDYPGVAVGGPSVLSSDGAFMLDFIETCGDIADFYTMHFYNQDPVRMTRRISDWADYIRDQTGKNAVVHITESDDWNLTGPAKIDYLLTRQFELIALGDRIGSFHHFSLPYYRESPGRVFGLLRPDGRPVDYNYLPYLLFSQFTGEEVPVQVEIDALLADPARDHREPLPAYAAASRTEEALTAVAYFRNPGIGDAVINLTLPELPGLWTLRVDQLGWAANDGTGAVAAATTAGPSARWTTTRFEAVDGRGDLAIPVDVGMGRAVRITLTSASPSAVDVVLRNGGRTVELLNGTPRAIRASIELIGLPSGQRVGTELSAAVEPGNRHHLVVANETPSMLAEDDTHIIAFFRTSDTDGLPGHTTGYAVPIPAAVGSARSSEISGTQ
jgi:hypothetical protein